MTPVEVGGVLGAGEQPTQLTVMMTRKRNVCSTITKEEKVHYYDYDNYCL